MKECVKSSFEKDTIQMMTIALFDTLNNHTLNNQI